MLRMPRLTLSLLFVVFMALGSYHGKVINDIQDSEVFYRWLLNSATQMRLVGTLVFDTASDLPDAIDDDLFERTAMAAEEFLPDWEDIDPERDYDPDGTLRSKLIRGARLEEDEWIWDFARDAGTEELRTEFLDHARNGKIRSLGSQLDLSTIYGESQIPGVGASTFLFGFRKLAANFTWLQVDKYWHEGQMHRMVPLMKTCVTLDPNFVDAFLLGAWHLAYNITAKLPQTPEPLKEWNEKYQKRLGYKEEWYYVAVDFLRDGILKNPRDYRLYFDLGYGIYENKLSDHANAVRYLDEARRHRHDKWVPRMLYLAMMRNGQHEDAISGWEDYMQKFPDNIAAPRFLQINKGYLAEIRFEEALECSKAAAAAADALRAKTGEFQGADADAAAQYTADAAVAQEVSEEMAAIAELEMATAMGIWQALYDQNDDPLAHARMSRIKAVELIEAGRLYEALAILDVARWEANEMFVEVSQMMMDIKLEADLVLTVSERLYIQRQTEAKEAIERQLAMGRNVGEEFKMPRRIECAYIDDDAKVPTGP